MVNTTIHSMENCSICKIDLKSPEERVHYADDGIAIVDTLDKKGHEGRIMVYVFGHTREPPEQARQYAREKLIETARTAIDAPRIIVYGTMATVPGHWHLIASDLDGNDIRRLRQQFYEEGVQVDCLENR